MKRRTGYSEPDDFIPRSLRKKFKLGEYNTDVYKDETAKKRKTSTTKK